MSISDLTRNWSILKEDEYIDLEDKITHDYIGFF